MEELFHLYAHLQEPPTAKGQQLTDSSVDQIKAHANHVSDLPLVTVALHRARVTFLLLRHTQYINTHERKTHF